MLGPVKQNPDTERATAPSAANNACAYSCDGSHTSLSDDESTRGLNDNAGALQVLRARLLRDYFVARRMRAHHQIREDYR